MKENRNKTQVCENILECYYKTYKPQNQTFKTNFSKYLEPSETKEVLSFRISHNLNKNLEMDSKVDNRNKSQLLECIFVEYLVAQGLMK